jgi:two-component system LytT family response regulator
MKSTHLTARSQPQQAEHQSEQSQAVAVPSSQSQPNETGSVAVLTVSPTQPCRPLRLRIAGTSGFELLVIEDITHLEADGNVTHVYLSNGRKVTAGRNLGYYESSLLHCGFCRIHHRYLANLLCVKQYHNTDRQITLTTGMLLPVSLQRTRAFVEAVEGFSF